MQPIRAYCTNQSLVGYLAVLLVATPAILVVASFAVAIGCVENGTGLSHRRVRLSLGRSLVVTAVVSSVVAVGAVVGVGASGGVRARCRHI
eukprot:COSAG02_NODE_10071_length_2033_cov_5.110134_2_plen_91_part_00